MRKLIRRTVALTLGMLISVLAFAGLETGTYISDLVSTNPLSSDLASTSDDHLRLLKSTIKATFPNINGAVSATDEVLSAAAATNVTNTFSVLQELEMAAPKLQFDETDATTNERNWLINSVAGVWALSSATDAAPTTVASDAITVDRTGTTIGNIAINTAALSVGTGFGSPAFTVTGSTLGRVLIKDTGAATDEQTYEWRSNDGQLLGRAQLDNDSTGATWMVVDRTGTTVDRITFTAVSLENEALAPIFQVDETDAPSNERNWLYRSVAGALHISTAADSTPTTAASNAITIDRTGTTVDSINLQATAVQANGATICTTSSCPIVYGIRVTAGTFGVTSDSMAYQSGNASGITSAVTMTDSHTVTHNFGTSNYAPSCSVAESGNGIGVVITGIGNNSFTATVVDETATVVGIDFSCTIVR